MPVQVTFAKNLPDNLKRMQEQSFQHHSKKSQEEPWIHTNYIPFYDTQTEVSIDFSSLQQYGMAVIMEIVHILIA